MAEPYKPDDRTKAAMGSKVDSFIRRNQRFNIAIPVVFHAPEGSVRGRSIDISESGIFAAFERELELWLTGRLTGKFGDRDIDFGVRVARIEGRKAGLVFQNLSDKDVAVIRRLIRRSTGDVS